MDTPVQKILSQQTHEDALRASAGAGVGFVLSTVAKLGRAAAMLGLYFLSVWNALPWKIAD